MTKRPNFLRRIFSRIAGRKDAQPKPELVPAKPRAKRQTQSSFEPLEGRIAPAILISPKVVQYKDPQGDLVTVTFSKPLFIAGAGLDATLDRVFKFDTGNVRSNGDANAAQVLQTLDLTGYTTTPLNQSTSLVNGVSITIFAETQNGIGDGLADVGFIDANQSAINGLTLGKILIEGDLGRIDAGVANKAVAVQSLIVNSLGGKGTTTQGTGGTLSSTIFGAVGSLGVNTDVKDVIFSIENGNVIAGKQLVGNLGSLVIGGKLSATLTAVDAGSMSVDGNIGKVKVGTLPSDGIYGGGSQGTGRIQAGGKIGSLMVSGDIRGSAGKDSGQVAADKGIGDVTLRFSIFAGSGENSGRIVSSGGSIGLVSLFAIRGEQAVNGGASGKNAGTISALSGISGLTLTGSVDDGRILGGAGEGSGSVQATSGNIGKVSMLGTLAGGAGLKSGRIFAGGDLGTVSIGVLAGGGGSEAGNIRAGDDLGTVFVSSITGSTGGESGSIRAGGDAKSIFVNGSLTGGNGIGSGAIRLDGDAKSIVVKGVVTGGVGTESGSIRVNDLTSLLIENSAAVADGIAAGTGIRSGFIGVTGDAGKLVVNGSLNATIASAKESGGSISVGGKLGALTVTKSLIGGVAEANGSIIVTGKVGTISIGEAITGGGGNYSGSISVDGAATSITVGGNVTGGGGLFSGAINVGASFVTLGNLKSVAVAGTLFGGGGINSGLIYAGGVIAKATIGNAENPIADVVRGGTGAGSGGIYGAHGLGKVTVFGNLAGGDGNASGTIRAGGVAQSITLTGAITGALGSQSGSVRIGDDGELAGALVSLKLGALIGGAGDDSGQVWADGTLASVSLTQANGSTGLRTGSIFAGLGNVAASEGLVKLGSILSVQVSGSVQASTGAESGSIIAGGSIKAVTVVGSMSGSTISAGRDLGSLTAGSLSGVEIRALGQAVPKKTDVAIAKLTILGGVAGSKVLAGYDRFGNATNGDAQIGSVSVTGDWTNSSLLAGVLDVNADGFASADDTVIAGSNAQIVSKIASVVLGGNGGGQFVAQQIDSMTVAGVKVALTTAKNTIVLTNGLNEITIREVA